MFKKNICENYKKGFCLKGDSCPFLHLKFKTDEDDNMRLKEKKTFF